MKIKIVNRIDRFGDTFYIEHNGKKVSTYVEWKCNQLVYVENLKNLLNKCFEELEKNNDKQNKI